MKFSWKLASLLAGVAALAACSGITTSADYDRNVDFSKYKTYAWKDVRQAQNQLLENRLKGAIDTVLASRGLRKVDSEPDLWVVEHTHLTKETQVNTYDSGWGYGYGRWGGSGMSSTTVSEIPIGNLVVDLVDAREKQMVWRGTASKAVDSTATAEQRDKMADEVAQKLFAGYPPAK